MNDPKSHLGLISSFLVLVAFSLDSTVGAQENPYAEPEEPGQPRLPYGLGHHCGRRQSS